MLTKLTSSDLTRRDFQIEQWLQILYSNRVFSGSVGEVCARDGRFLVNGPQNRICIGLPKLLVTQNAILAKMLFVAKRPILLDHFLILSCICSFTHPIFQAPQPMRQYLIQKLVVDKVEDFA